MEFNVYLKIYKYTQLFCYSFKDILKFDYCVILRMACRLRKIKNEIFYPNFTDTN